MDENWKLGGSSAITIVIVCSVAILVLLLAIIAISQWKRRYLKNQKKKQEFGSTPGRSQTNGHVTGASSAEPIHPRRRQYQEKVTPSFRSTLSSSYISQYSGDRDYYREEFCSDISSAGGTFGDSIGSPTLAIQNPPFPHIPVVIPPAPSPELYTVTLESCVSDNKIIQKPKDNNNTRPKLRESDYKTIQNPSDSNDTRPESRESDYKTIQNPNNNDTRVKNEDLIAFDAPPGRLGVVIDLQDGRLLVTEIKKSSTMLNKLKLGDQLIYIDDEDVTNLTARDVAQRMSRKNANSMRTLKILRTES